MSSEIVYLENFFSKFDTNLTEIESNLDEHSNETCQLLESYIESKQVELKLNASRKHLIQKLNNQFRLQFDIVKNLLTTQLTEIVARINDTFDYNDFKLVLFKLKCKLFDYGLLYTDKSNILNETIIDMFYNDSYGYKLDQLLKLIENLFSNLKVLFKANESNFNICFIGDIFVKNDLINLGKCDYFHLYSTFDDSRLASETLARNNHLNYKLLPLTPYQIFIYPKSFNQTAQIQIIDSNGNELFRQLKNNVIELTPYHFILTSSYLIAVFYNLETSKYSCDLYDLRLNLIRSREFKRLINLIEINENTIELKAVINRTNELIDAFKIENNEFKVENSHLKNRILFSYNNTYQGYIIKIKSSDYLFRKVVSSHLQVANKSLTLAYSNSNSKILLEFTSYDKKYYDFTNLTE